MKINISKNNQLPFTWTFPFALILLLFKPKFQRRGKIFFLTSQFIFVAMQISLLRQYVPGTIISWKHTKNTNKFVYLPPCHMYSFYKGYSSWHFMPGVYGHWLILRRDFNKCHHSLFVSLPALFNQDLWCDIVDPLLIVSSLHGLYVKVQFSAVLLTE